MPDLVERHAPVGGEFAREAEDAFADHVARHLRRATTERCGLPGQVALADEHQVSRSVHDAGAARDG